MTKTLFLLRHSAIPENELGINGSRTDSPLSENGIKDAKGLVTVLSKNRYDLIIVSPLKRTAQTIRPYLDTLTDKPEVLVDPLTIERDLGVFTNTKVGGPIPDDIKRQGVGQVQWQPEGGESTIQVGVRAKEFLDKLRNSSNKSILICGHQNFLRCLELLILRYPIDDEHFFSDNPSKLKNGELRQIIID